MKYMGSKNRHAESILKIIMENHTTEMDYVEPFVGGANVIDKVPASLVNSKKGYDINEYLIAALDAASKGWMPPQVITEQQYEYISKNRDEDKILTGYVGFALSYGGKWFGGWCRDSAGKRDYVNEAYRNAAKQFPKLKDCIFQHKSYDKIIFNNKSTIYCDPPYKDTTKYKTNFDHELFYEWCIEKHQEGHNIWISEYAMPEDKFIAVWEKSTSSSLTKDTGSKKAVEKLYKVKEVIC